MIIHHRKKISKAKKLVTDSFKRTLLEPVNISASSNKKHLFWLK